MTKALWITVAALASIGCQAAAPLQPGDVSMPAYGDLVARYNRNIQNLDRMWAAAVVEARWTDDKGKNHHAQGDNSKLMMLGRDRLAMSVSKSVKDLLWIGCDALRYWWIELGEEPTAYVGWHDKLYAGRSHALPVDIRPLDLPVLMGLVQFDPSKLPAKEPHVTRYQGQYVITPPGAGARLTLDATSAMPVKVEMFDRRGKRVIQSKLSEPSRVKVDKLPPGGWPAIMTRVELSVDGHRGWMRIHLSRMTDARARDETRKDRALQHAFDYDKLKRALRVSREYRLDK